MNAPHSDLILLVDDDPINLSITSRILAQAGLRTITTQDGAIALSKAKREQPALILLDIMMPEISGYEVCQRLKASEDTRTIPIIFMTALSYNNDKVRAFEAGASDYVIKPIQSEELLARITTHLTIIHQRNEINALKEKLARYT
jgi:DNA-binding response OmpR family regulator